jgi:hypothetical protein
MFASIYFICSDSDHSDINFHGTFHHRREVEDFLYDQMLRDRPTDESTRLYGWAIHSVREELPVGKYLSVAAPPSRSATTGGTPYRRGEDRWFHIYRYLPNDVDRTLYISVSKDLEQPSGLVDFHYVGESYEEAVDAGPNCYNSLNGDVTNYAQVYNVILPHA